MSQTQTLSAKSSHDTAHGKQGNTDSRHPTMEAQGVRASGGAGKGKVKVAERQAECIPSKMTGSGPSRASGEGTAVRRRPEESAQAKQGWALDASNREHGLFLQAFRSAGRGVSASSRPIRDRKLPAGSLGLSIRRQPSSPPSQQPAGEQGKCEEGEKKCQVRRTGCWPSKGCDPCLETSL